MLRTPTRAGFIAGLLATIALLAVLYLIGPLTGASFAPADLADIVIRLTPGQIATQGIEALGTLAKLSIRAATVIVWALLGGLIGALAGRATARGTAPGLARNIAGFAMFAALLGVGVLNTQANQGSALQPIAFLSLIVLALAWAGLLGYLLRGLTPESPPEPIAEPQTDRRTFLLRSGAAVITVAVGSTALAELFRPGADVTAMAASWPQPRSVTPEPAFDEAGFAAPSGVRDRITPQNELYYVSSRVRDPQVDAASFKLDIGGNVGNTLSLTLDQIQQMPRVQQTSTLECISNEVGGNLIGNCTWVGTPLAPLIEQAGVLAGSQRLALYGADGYVDSIALEDALKPTTLLVYGIDDQPLTTRHGYPLRLIVPNIYGMKNVKWLQKIEVVTFDLQGFWQERGWSQPAIVKTTSVTDTRVPAATDGIVPIGGIAFAGSRGIQKVEVRVDDGAWQAATLEPEASPLQWRRWRYDWQNAQPGSHTIEVRATDGAGEVQTDRLADPHPDGASGYHSIRVRV